MQSPVWGKSGMSSPGFPKWEGCPHSVRRVLLTHWSPQRMCRDVFTASELSAYYNIDPVTTQVHQNREKLSPFSVNCKELCVALPGLLHPPECAAHVRGLSKFRNMCSCPVRPYFLKIVAGTNVHNQSRFRFLRLNAASNFCYQNRCTSARAY